MNPDRVPTSLVIVAVLFILGGAYSVIEVLVSLTHHRISINFGVLGLFIGHGLLRLRSGWRTCALVFIWIALIGTPIVAWIMLTVDSPLELSVFEQPVGHAPKAVGMIFAAIVFAVALWKYHVLTRPDVRRLFGVTDAGWGEAE